MVSARFGRPLLAGAATAFATWLVYLAVILAEDDNAATKVVTWSVVMVTPAVVAAACALAGPRSRLLALADAVVLAIIGVVAMFSVGLGFLLAAALVLAGAVRD